MTLLRADVITRINSVEDSKEDYVRFMTLATDKDFTRLPFTREQMIQYMSNQTSFLLTLRKRMQITDKEILDARAITSDVITR